MAEATPTDAPMTPEEFRAARERLGLSVGALARRLGVNVRTVRRWQNGHHNIPAPVAVAVAALVCEAA